MNDIDLCYSSIGTVARLIKSGRLSPVELTKVVLARLKATQPVTNAFITVLEKEALSQARAAERAIVRGEYRGPLHGVPVSVKDIYDYKGHLTTCGSAVLHDNVAKEDAHTVACLKDAGAILIGKANMTEFAVGHPSPVYDVVHNPWDPERIAGLSSSGSAASLVAGVGYASLGTDTGGSIRLPAAFSGCVGIKPTYGRVSRHGVFPLSWTMDHAGPLARTVRDAAIALQAIAGYDPKDATTSQRLVPNYLRGITKGVRGLRVGLPREYFDGVIDAEITPVFEAAVRQLTDLGAEVHEVSLHHVDKISLTASVISPEHAAAVADLLRTRLHLFGNGLGERLVAASLRPASEYIDGQRARVLVMQDFQQALSQVDILATPTTPILPYKIEEQGEVGLGPNAAIARFTIPFNTTGLPAISVPCGFSAGGLPVGLQLVAPAFQEALLFRAAHAYEQATDWHLRRPLV